MHRRKQPKVPVKRAQSKSKDSEINQKQLDSGKGSDSYDECSTSTENNLPQRADDSYSPKMKILDPSMCQIDQFIPMIRDKTVGKEFFEILIDRMVELDVKISIESDGITKSDWYAIECPISTPSSNEQLRNLREDVQLFIKVYLELQEFVLEYQIVDFFKLFEKYIFISGTRYLQYLLFNFNPESVLIYFFSSIKKNHHLSSDLVGLASSYIITRKMDDALLSKSFKCFFKLLNDTKNHNLRLDIIQSIVQMLLVHKTFFSDYSECIVPLVEQFGSYLNKKIVKQFLKEFDLKKIKIFIETRQSKIDRYHFDHINIQPIRNTIIDKINQQDTKDKHNTTVGK